MLIYYSIVHAQLLSLRRFKQGCSPECVEPSPRKEIPWL